MPVWSLLCVFLIAISDPKMLIDTHFELEINTRRAFAISVSTGLPKETFIYSTPKKFELERFKALMHEV